MINNQELFDNYIKEFLKLSLEQKEEEVIEKQKTILAYLVTYATANNINFNLLKSREISDIDKSNSTHDDYIEAMMVYNQNIEDLIGIVLQNYNV